MSTECPQDVQNTLYKTISSPHLVQNFASTPVDVVSTGDDFCFASIGIVGIAVDSFCLSVKTPRTRYGAIAAEIVPSLLTTQLRPPDVLREENSCIPSPNKFTSVPFLSVSYTHLTLPTIYSV